MKFPNKVTPYKKSVLAKFPILLEVLKNEGKTPAELYEKVKSKVDDVAEFTKILDCLFALGKIEILEEGVLINAKRD
jgi:hypothetical protein